MRIVREAFQIYHNQIRGRYMMIPDEILEEIKSWNLPIKKKYDMENIAKIYYFLINNTKEKPVFMSVKDFDRILNIGNEHNIMAALKLLRDKGLVSVNKSSYPYAYWANKRE